MLLSLFSKDYRFFSLKSIVDYVENNEYKDLIFCFHQTVEVFLLQAGAIYPGDLQKRARETDGRINLFYTKDLEEYKKLKKYKNGQITVKNNVVYNNKGEDLVTLESFNNLGNINVNAEKYSTVIIDETHDNILKNYPDLVEYANNHKEIFFTSVDGIKIH